MKSGSSRESYRDGGKGVNESAQTKQKQSTLDIKSFKDSNKDYILRVQRAWQPFDSELKTFFKALRQEIDWIEKDAQARLLEEELRTAVNSHERRLIDLSRNIFNQKLDRVTSKEIEQFQGIKNKQEGSRNFLRIEKQEEDFALDLIDDIKKAVQYIGKSLTDTKNRQRERQRQREGNTPKQAAQTKRQETRNEGRREDREQKAEKVENKRNDRQERQTRRQNRKREDNADNLRKPERQQRQPRREDKRQEDNETKRPERQSRQNGRKEEGAREGQRPERETRQNAERRPKQSKTFKKLKIIDLTESSDEFSIDIRFICFLKSLKDRDVWKVGDGSGQIKLVIPEHESFKVGANITLNNCFVRAHNEELQIVTKMYSTITSPEIGNNIDVGFLAKNNPRRNNAKQDRETGGPTFKNFTKIGDIEPGLQGIKLIAKVIAAKTNKNTIQCVLGDQTGIVNARFDSGDQFLKIDNTVYLRDLNSDITGDSEGTIILVPGKRLLIENAREKIKKAKTDNNISLRVYQAYDDQ